MQKDFLFSKKTFSPHQKTLLKLALSYGESKIYAPTTKQIAELANFLSLDTKDLLRALNENHHLYDGDKIIFAEDSSGDFIRSDYQLFHALLNLFFFKSSLNSVAKETNFSLKKFEFYQSCQFHLTNLNSSISTYECYKRSEYDYRYSPLNSCCNNIHNYIDFLRMKLNYDDFLSNDQIALTDILLRYELVSLFNSLRLILLCQIIRDSPYFDMSTKKIANDLFSYFLFVLQNAKLIFFQTNSNPILNQNANIRGASDNTTRIQMVYTYSNFDSYSLRFDLAHKGQEITHSNNISPGKNSCAILPTNEYTKITEKFPDAKDFFVKYGTKFGLKEISNCIFNDEKQKAIYYKIQDKFSHTSLFQENFTDREIEGFMDTLNQFYLYQYFSPISKDNDKIDNCFRFCTIIKYIYALHLISIVEMYSSGNDSNNIKLRLREKLLAFNIMSEEEIQENCSIEELCFAIECNYEKFFIL